MSPIEILNRKIVLKRQAVFIILEEVRTLQAIRNILRTLDFLEARISDGDPELSRVIDCANVVLDYLETR